MVTAESERQCSTRPAPSTTLQSVSREHRHGVAVEPLFISVSAAAKALGVGRTYAYELIDRGRLRAVRDGRRRLVPVESVREYAARLIAESEAAETQAVEADPLEAA